MKKLTILIILCSLLPCAYAKYSGGTGEPNTPYLIATPEDLNAIGDDSNDWDKHFLLTADINMAGYIYTTAIIAPDTNPLKWRFQGTAFTGTFDGDGHTVFSLIINGGGINDYLGLFGKLEQDANIINLNIEDANITGDDSLGGLCGVNWGGTINNCSASGSLSGGDSVGGLCGENWSGGSIKNCYAESSTSGRVYVGGLCGQNASATISNSYAESSTSGRVCVGGLCGYNDYGTINNCYAESSTSGGDYVGGLCGYNGASTISNCYATGSVTGDGALGGLCGYHFSGAINNCYFLDPNDGGGPDNGRGTVLTDTEMKQQASFVNWDFNDIWGIIENVTYPFFLLANKLPVAVTGPNQVVYACIDELVDVNLDGSASYDDDGDDLDYYWSWIIDNNVCEANGVSPTIQLPAGEYEIELVVDDGIDFSEPNYCTITVVEPLHAKLFCYPRFINTQSRRRTITAFFCMPAGITPEDVNQAESLMFIPGQVESTRQFVFQWRKHGRPCTWIMASFDKDDCVDNLSLGMNRIKVVGRLNSGQCYYGNSRIYVFTPRPFRRSRRSHDD